MHPVIVNSGASVMPTKPELMYRQLLEQHGILLRQNDALRAIIRQTVSDLQIANEECVMLREQLEELL